MIKRTTGECGGCGSIDAVALDRRSSVGACRVCRTAVVADGPAWRPASPLEWTSLTPEQVAWLTGEVGEVTVEPEADQPASSLMLRITKAQRRTILRGLAHSQQASRGTSLQKFCVAAVLARTALLERASRAAQGAAS